MIFEGPGPKLEPKSAPKWFPRRPKRPLGASWRRLGASWGRLGASWGRLGLSWGPLGRSWGRLGPSWGGFWHPSRAKWGGPGGPGGGSWAKRRAEMRRMGRKGRAGGAAVRRRRPPGNLFGRKFEGLEDWKNSRPDLARPAPVVNHGGGGSKTPPATHRRPRPSGKTPPMWLYP